MNYKNIILSFLSLFLITACLGGVDQDTEEVFSENIEDYEDYHLAVEIMKNEFGVTPETAIVFDFDGENTNFARCIRSENKEVNLIQINFDFWTSIDPIGREKLLVHEFAHCELYVDHFGEGLMSPSFPFGVVAYAKDKVGEIQKLKDHILEKESKSNLDLNESEIKVILD